MKLIRKIESVMLPYEKIKKLNEAGNSEELENLKSKLLVSQNKSIEPKLFPSPLSWI